MLVQAVQGIWQQSKQCLNVKSLFDFIDNARFKLNILLSNWNTLLTASKFYFKIAEQANIILNRRGTVASTSDFTSSLQNRPYFNRSVQLKPHYFNRSV